MHACVISDSSLPSEGIWSRMITYIVRHSFQTTQPSICVFYFKTIKQRGRVVYERIVNEEEAWLDYSLIDNEAELSNCFSDSTVSNYLCINLEKKATNKLNVIKLFTHARDHAASHDQKNVLNFWITSQQHSNQLSKNSLLGNLLNVHCKRCVKHYVRKIKML